MTVCRLRANAFKKDVVTLVLKDLNIISKPNSLLYDVIYVTALRGKLWRSIVYS